MSADAFTIGFLLAVGAACAFAVLRRARDLRRAKDWLLDHGALAQGEILDVWQEDHGAYCVRYRFVPEGAAAPLTRDEYVGCLAATVPERGSRVGVRYDPAQPARSLLARRED